MIVIVVTTIVATDNGGGDNNDNDDNDNGNDDDNDGNNDHTSVSDDNHNDDDELMIIEIQNITFKSFRNLKIILNFNFNFKYFNLWLLSKYIIVSMYAFNTYHYSCGIITDLTIGISTYPLFTVF